ncbi:MAG: TIGR03960 family B12-binding radical SAM protein [Candidatus Lernaella stagnicola]|nr:TIGR03960 family B12-binding radical SAM protein [Candidatus Lernaella stagnicola]
MDELLAQVEKPARYTGGEIGSVRKEPSAVDVRFALAFPDVYEIGMSHLGYQLLYAALNELTWCAAERVYAPWPDMEKVLRDVGLPLFALESKEPIADFDVLGFTLQYELAAAGVLQMLDLAGLPLLAADRSDDAPLTIAGGPCATNPESWAPFFDALVLGDGEEVVVEIADAVREVKGRSGGRQAMLEAVAKIAGVYVPSRRTPRFDGARFDGFDLDPGEPERVRRRLVHDLDATPLPRRPLVSNIQAVHDRLALEVMRGCLRGCRFCQAGYLYRPAREREGATIARAARESLATTGYDEVGLLSLSTGDWSPVQTVIPHMMNELAPQRIALSLPSLRAESLEGELAEAISRVRRTGFTLAPEAATERLRRVINKPISDDMVLESVRRVFEAGWEIVKLYFMIGLPTETDEDVAAIFDLVDRVYALGKSVTKRARVNVTVSIFVPKPHTPFERFGMADPEIVRHRMEPFLATKRKRRGGAVYKVHDWRTSLVEAALARADRRAAAAIEAAYRAGARFDGWSEYFRLDRWREAFAAAGIDLEAAATRRIPDGDPLPWDGVDVGVDKAFLQREKERALAAEVTEDCRTGRCGACGACIDEAANDFAAPAIAEPPISLAAAPPEDARFRYWFRYRRFGPTRWLGHLDLSRAMARAARRAALPLVYSQGFHPLPKIAFGPPLAVGIASDAEWFELTLNESLDAAQVRSELARELPEGIELCEAHSKALDAPSINGDVVGFVYEIDLSRLDAPAAGEAVTRFLAAENWPVDIVKKGKARRVDARSLVAEARVEGDSLHVRQMMKAGGGLKIAVLAAEMLGLPGRPVNPTAIRKTETLWRE